MSATCLHWNSFDRLHFAMAYIEHHIHSCLATTRICPSQVTRSNHKRGGFSQQHEELDSRGTCLTVHSCLCQRFFLAVSVVSLLRLKCECCEVINSFACFVIMPVLVSRILASARMTFSSCLTTSRGLWQGLAYLLARLIRQFALFQVQYL